MHLSELTLDPLPLIYPESRKTLQRETTVDALCLSPASQHECVCATFTSCEAVLSDLHLVALPSAFILSHYKEQVSDPFLGVLSMKTRGDINS